MKLERVTYIAQYEAEEMLPDDDTQILVSITDIDVEADLRYWEEDNVLRLTFTDVEPGLEYPERYIEFSEEHALQILEFVSSKCKTDLVIHCFAGASRSAGVAKFFAELNSLPFEDRYDQYNKLVYTTLKKAYSKWYYRKRD